MIELGLYALPKNDKLAAIRMCISDPQHLQLLKRTRPVFGRMRVKFQKLLAELLKCIIYAGGFCSVGVGDFTLIAFVRHFVSGRCEIHVMESELL